MMLIKGCKRNSCIYLQRSEGSSHEAATAENEEVCRLWGSEKQVGQGAYQTSEAAEKEWGDITVHLFTAILWVICSL